jgi:hypothetical protein
LLAALLRDQASENLPAADLLAAELSRQLGVRITRRRLVSMPDDPALGEFREAFAGAVGTFSEYPEPGPGGAPGTFGATEIVDSERLWQEVRSGKGASVDARAHLRARLIDWWIGDWDRHPEQWRWGLVDPSKRYVPLPEDHDHAFSHADGVLVLAAVRPLFPWIGPWDDDPSLRGMTFTSWWLDAWILAGLDRGDWLEEITAFEASIGPEVVEEALARFPRSWRALVGDEIRALLRARGAVLQRYALDVYASLSRIVHLYGSEADDRLEVDCLDGRVAVTLQAASGPRLRRVFTPGECKVGIMPSHIYSKGRVGVVSRSGTLNYEAVSQMTALGLGQSTCVGIGGDPVNGTDFKTVLQAFEGDDETDVIVMIGEIGGQQEVEAASWASQYMSKPLVAFIAGVSAPRGRRMGHAGAVIAGESDTATAKLDAIEALGHRVVRNPADIGDTVLRTVKEAGVGAGAGAS